MALREAKSDISGSGSDINGNLNGHKWNLRYKSIYLQENTNMKEKLRRANKRQKQEKYKSDS